MIRQLMRRARGLWPERAPAREPGAVVLLYHRVASPGRDPWSLSVSPAHFAEQLAVLQALGCVGPLSRAERLARDGREGERAVAITFDDGYADNLHAAAPLLARHGLPATVFVAVGYVGTRRMFWWDELERMVFDQDVDASVLTDWMAMRSESGGGGARGVPTGAATGTAARGGPWWRWRPQRPRTLVSMYVTLWSALRDMPPSELDDALAELRALSGVTADAPDGCRPLSDAELTELATVDGVEVGAHTVNHPRLSALGVESQRWEIGASRAMLEERVGRPVTRLSYPFGGVGDFTPQCAAAAGEAGFSSAWTTRRAVARVGDAPHQLPRVAVPDLDGAAFESMLHSLLPPPPRPRRPAPKP